MSFSNSVEFSLRPRFLLGRHAWQRTTQSAAGTTFRVYAVIQNIQNKLQKCEEVPRVECSRREHLGGVALAACGIAALLTAPAAEAIELGDLGFKKDLTSKRRVKIPESAYTDGPQGIKYYDMVVGTGVEAQEGERVVVHYEAKWKGVTFVTSRQGMGVTGGNPLGFNVGAKPGAGGTLAGLDLGVRGMKVGGRRKLLVPPELAYGSRGFGEIPPNATLEFDVELLTVKTSVVGYRTKIIEG